MPGTPGRSDVLGKSENNGEQRLGPSTVQHSNSADTMMDVANACRRRDWLKGGTAVVAGGLASLATGGAGAARSEPAPPRRIESRETDVPFGEGRFLFGLNTSTIRGQKLSIIEEILIAEKAGYQ